MKEYMKFHVVKLIQLCEVLPKKSTLLAMVDKDSLDIQALILSKDQDQ